MLASPIGQDFGGNRAFEAAPWAAKVTIEMEEPLDCALTEWTQWCIAGCLLARPEGRS